MGAAASLGRLDRGWVVASETAALDIVSASFVRDIEPGELLAIDSDGVRSTRFARPPGGCVFEYVSPCPPGQCPGRTIRSRHPRRHRATSCREKPVEADLVIGVPESGTPAAVGYAQESGIPFGQGLMKNAYVGRTFIQPSQTIRQWESGSSSTRSKRSSEASGSLWSTTPSWGNTQRALIRMLREAGAIEVHVRIASPR